jgi:MtaA/CmuA family methyltransferase
VAFPGPQQPLAGTGEPAIRSAADIARIPPPDPTRQGRCPLMLEALRLVKEAIGRETFVVACFDQYPFSLACALMGIERVMTQIVDDRAMVEALMDKCAEYSIAYARALADAGADMLSGGDSPAGLIGPQLYREVALPYEQRVIAALGHSKGDSPIFAETKIGTVPVSLHICGNAMLILADMAASGADVLELDHQVDIAAAFRVLGPEIAVWGNLDPVGLLVQGTAGDVRRATSDLLKCAAACGHRRLVVSSGCTLAPDTPAENIEALIETAARWEQGAASFEQ